jgi:hypothetical protein
MRILAGAGHIAILKEKTAEAKSIAVPCSPRRENPGEAAWREMAGRIRA